MSNTPNTDSTPREQIESWWWECNGSGTGACPRCVHYIVSEKDRMEEDRVCTWHSARLAQLESLIAHKLQEARIDEEMFWQGFLDNDEVDKEELKTHHGIRLAALHKIKGDE